MGFHNEIENILYCVTRLAGLSDDLRELRDLGISVPKDYDTILLDAIQELTESCRTVNTIHRGKDV